MGEPPERREDALLFCLSPSELVDAGQETTSAWVISLMLGVDFDLMAGWGTRNGPEEHPTTAGNYRLHRIALASADLFVVNQLIER